MLLFSASSFTLAPESRRLARERRNGKQRLKASLVEAFFIRVILQVVSVLAAFAHPSHVLMYAPEDLLFCRLDTT
ncbi:pheST operon leader peptide PheM [Citrobacter sp. wls717]|nr:pheST operon leader peptide PheM [Citrobacter werkmanii]MBQ4935658.1 pheST operon leader peptide PheM [Citrobacter werkmanii]QET66272.1 pheST operon leader peptide PheM [Citrobacter werkmanii]TKU31826.1 pheST operon leader peptide PheM [Citrobacter sp. wls717]